MPGMCEARVCVTPWLDTPLSVHTHTHTSVQMVVDKHQWQAQRWGGRTTACGSTLRCLVTSQKLGALVGTLFVGNMVG